ncbi:MAG: NAD(P)H-hydrate dehydratase [Pyrinomonadaceae bacterium]
MLKVLTAEQMREVDRLTTERYGIPSILLMENAAHAVARVITEKLGGSVKGKSVLILCGKGNNGGDGAALGRILWTHGAKIDIFLLGLVADTKGDARVNLDLVKKLSERDLQITPFIKLHEFESVDWRLMPDVCHHDVFVDALQGTGLTRPLDDETKQFAMRSRAQTSRAFSIAIDLPSGLIADSGEIIGPVFPSDVTVTFTAPKAANVLAPAASFNGSLIVTQIGTPAENFDLDDGYISDMEGDLFLTRENDAAEWLRSSSFEDGSYKGKRGHALIVAGSEDYSGAAVMCGNSAMRSGVGLTTLLVPASCKVEVASRVIPEVIVRTFAGANEVLNPDVLVENENVLRNADSILVGPGLNANDIEIERFVWEIVETRTTAVIVDAGALGFFIPPVGLPKFRDDVDTQVDMPSVGPPLILTPHEGEFMRLLGTDEKKPIKDRVAAVRDYATTNGVILVLKGERVLIGSPDGRVVVNPTGNSGLGKAGNGDTLAGILAGFVAQAVKFDIDIFETVVAAVYVAGMAGDVAEKKYGKRVMTASDVRECLVEVFTEFEKKG